MRAFKRSISGAAIAIALVLAGCGGGQSAGTAPEATSASTSSGGTTSSATTSAAVSSSAATTSASASSSAATATGSAGQAVSFKADIQPIVAANCVSCHGRAGGLSLASYADLIKGGKDGAVVKPGDADGSLLVQKVKGTQTIGARMPFSRAPLPDADIQKIASWVAQGAKDN
jgi:mono/diheme cytochrome c family protein